MMCSNPKPLSNPQFDSNLPGYNMSSRIDKSSWLQYPGLWFQTCFIFHFIYGIIPTPWTNSIIFQDGCCTINQYLFLVTIDKSDIIRIWFLSSYFPGTEQSTNGSSVSHSSQLDHRGSQTLGPRWMRWRVTSNPVTWSDRNRTADWDLMIKNHPRCGFEPSTYP